MNSALLNSQFWISSSLYLQNQLWISAARAKEYESPTIDNVVGMKTVGNDKKNIIFFCYFYYFYRNGRK